MKLLDAENKDTLVAGARRIKESTEALIEVMENATGFDDPRLNTAFLYLGQIDGYSMLIHHQLQEHIKRVSTEQSRG
jgi:hypothetical protein